jgi:hypothetical protein
MEPEKTLSFQLPAGRSVDVFIVRLPDGSIVARTAAELLALPAGAQVQGPAVKP